MPAMPSRQGVRLTGIMTHGEEQRFGHGGPAVGLDDGQHANAGAGVVVAVEPGDGHEVRELPDKENGEEGHGRPLDAAASGGPAQHGTHGAGKCADEGGHGGDALERRIDGDVSEGGEQRQGHGEQVGGERQPHRAEGQRAEAGQDALGQREASGGHGTVGGALHARVDFALQGLVQRARSGRDQADAEERVEQAALHAGDAGLHGAQIKAAPAGDQHQADDFDLEELAQVVDERGGCAGAGRVDGRRAARFQMVRQILREARLGRRDSSGWVRTSVRKRGMSGYMGACFDDSKRGSVGAERYGYWFLHK